MSGYVRSSKVVYYPDGVLSLNDRRYWIARTVRWNFPLPVDVDAWHPPDEMPSDEFILQSIEKMKRWQFLSPFFSSRGYTLYVYKPPGPGEYEERTIVPHIVDPLRDDTFVDTSYPFPIRLYQKAVEAPFNFTVSSSSI